MVELEEENEQYRQVLNLPPSNRPALGKGPTGKDKPKTPHTSRPSGFLPSASDALPSPIASIPANNPKSHPSPLESPPPSSTRSLSPAPSSSPARAHSLSPSNSMSAPSQSFRETSPTLAGLEIDSSWNYHTNTVTPKEQQRRANQHTSPRTASFTLNPGPHSPQPHLTSFCYSEPITTSSTMCMSHPSQALPPPPPAGHQQPVRKQHNEPHLVLRDVREDRRRYSFSQPSFPSPQDGSLHSPVSHDTSQVNSLTMPQHQDQTNSTQQQRPQKPFPHRRSVTQPQGFRGITNACPHLPSP